MRYYVPDIRDSSELPHQTSFEDKLGGLPWGIREKDWPKCKDCGRSQSLLAQFAHSPPALDIGRAGRVLSVFQCNHDPGMCSTWEGGSGANACLISEPEALDSGLCKAPPDALPPEREVRIAEWIENDDGVSAAAALRLLSDGSFPLPADENKKVTAATKLGSVPFWIQNPDEGPKGAWRFVGQLDSTYSFYTAPAKELSGVWADSKKWEGRTHYCEGPNFGDGGIAYLYVRNTETQPEGWFFWQCG
jgi:hypothetical protein